MSVKERLKKFLDYSNVSYSAFSESINASTGYVNAIRKSIPPEKLIVIKEKYPELNIDWLIFEKGKMLNSQTLPSGVVDTVDIVNITEDEESAVENSFGNRFTKLENGQYLMYMPLFEWDVAASLLDNDGDTRHPDYESVESHLTIVDKPLSGKYSAFRIKGASMEGTEPGKYIPDGSIVWGRELQQIHWRDPLRLNKHKLWIVGSTEFGRPTLKEIKKHNVETATIIVDSWNPSLEFAHNVEISLNTVRMLYYVMKIESSALY